MATRRRLPRETDAQETTCLAHIAGHGWHVMQVFDEDGGSPDFAYSVGLWHTFNHPEIIIFGHHYSWCASMVNSIGEDIRAGRRFAHGDRDTSFLDPFEVAFLDVLKEHYAEHLGWNCWLYGSDNFPALQCVFQERQSRAYPWEDGCTERGRKMQPVLGAPSTLR
jgi:hypothetical protein